MAPGFHNDQSKGGRKDRTFIGGECAVCEEQLELTLRGERILQLSCGHIAHEACFYEFLRETDSRVCPICAASLSLDSSRGGSVPNIDMLSSAVRQQPSSMPLSGYASGRLTSPTPWDSVSRNEDSTNHYAPLDRGSEHRHRRNRSGDVGLDRMGSVSGAVSDMAGHGRPGGGAANPLAGTDLPLERQTQGSLRRRHDYDLHSMETNLMTSRGPATFSAPPPIVTVRSEFPTLTRSKQQQSLTCLVTVEVNELNWRKESWPLSGGPSSGGPGNDSGPNSRSPNVRARPRRHDSQLELAEELERVTLDLHRRVDDWHGLDIARFGKLQLYNHMQVGKNRRAWQDLDCYLFSDMLICVKDRKHAPGSQEYSQDSQPSKWTLKGSILIKKHLVSIDASPDDNILILTLSVSELPSFYLHFRSRALLESWRRVLLDINDPQRSLIDKQASDYDPEASGTDDEDYKVSHLQRVSSQNSSYAGAKSNNTAPTEYSSSRLGTRPARLPSTLYIPLDLVIVVPLTSSMQGLKITLLRDALRFLVSKLGERDRMGLVTFGSHAGAVPIVGMADKEWNGWPKVLDQIRPVGQKALRADVVDGANVAMDLLMGRRSSNPLASIMLISDSAISEADMVDFVVQRAEAARECVAGVLGSLQATSHHNAKLKLRLPDGSPAKFFKISGALHYTKRATGRDAEAALGDLRYGDKRDILVQLIIEPDHIPHDQVPHDAWESIVSGLEALGGPLEADDHRPHSAEELPLLQADLSYGDLQRDCIVTHLPRTSLLAITMLPSNPRTKSTLSLKTSLASIPPHPHVVQRRMELLTSDMLTRALTLVSRGQHERAQHLLTETRSILKGLGKGGLPPLPNGLANRLPASLQSPTSTNGSTSPPFPHAISNTHDPDGMLNRNPEPMAPVPSSSQAISGPLGPVPTAMSTSSISSQSNTLIDGSIVAALEAELDSSLEWITHPAVFSRDSRKAILQTIGVISSQRAYTFRTHIESLWTERISRIRKTVESAREWREGSYQGTSSTVLPEES